LSQQEGFGSNQATVLDSEDLVEPIWMKGGVVFVGPYNDPGKALAKLLDPQSGVKKIAQGIKRVVYADAGLTNGQNVLREVRERRPDLDVYAFRVGAGDGVLDGWARILADFQWTQFQEKGVLLSDAEAIRQLNEPPRIELLQPRDGLEIDPKIYHAFSSGQGVNFVMYGPIKINWNLKVEIEMSDQFEQLMTSDEKKQIEADGRNKVADSFKLSLVIRRRLLAGDGPRERARYFGPVWPYDIPKRLVAMINGHTLNWISQQPDLFSRVDLHVPTGPNLE
jgi:hypothetical protein